MDPCVTQHQYVPLVDTDVHSTSTFLQKQDSVELAEKAEELQKIRAMVIEEHNRPEREAELI